jgi:glucuronosyltransferase
VAVKSIPVASAAHPNVRLFITHGGLLSKQEAMNRGVPLLGIPVYGEQQFNMRRAENFGYGIRLEFDNITADSVLWAIQTALQPRYRVNYLLSDGPVKFHTEGHPTANKQTPI